MSLNVKNFTGMIENSFKLPANSFHFDWLFSCPGRLKKIQDKKRIARAKAEAIKQARKLEGLDVDDETANIFDDDHDEDVLF